LATVITNLLSAIPWLGKSLVESIEKKFLFLIWTIILIISIFSNKITYSKILLFLYKLLNYSNNLAILDTIGVVNCHAYKKGRKVIVNKDKIYLLLF